MLMVALDYMQQRLFLFNCHEVVKQMLVCRIPEVKFKSAARLNGYDEFTSILAVKSYDPKINSPFGV